MPESRKRRPKRTTRQSPQRRRGLRPADELAAMWPYIQHMAAVDEAERRGDAATAIELIEQRLYGPDGKLFWRPWRIMRLSQLATYGPWLPRWVTSRWLLEQALQDLAPSTRRAFDRAMEIAVELRGGATNVRPPAGRDHRLKVMDHDWVFRQCFLYEFGGLSQFVRRAPADLVAGADRIRDWARTPMGGYRLLERRPAVTVWEDAATGNRVGTANIGSAVLLVPGEWAIGRLVPTEEGRMFETVPLRVPERVARAVATDPAGWLDALRDAGPATEPVRTGGHWFGFLTDVPPEVSALTVYGDTTLLEDYPRRARMLLDAVRVAFAVPPDDPEEVDVWACLAAELLHPNVFRALALDLRSCDADLFTRLGDTLADPAAMSCLQLARAASEAA